MVGVKTWTDDGIWYVLLASEIHKPEIASSTKNGRPTRRFTDEEIAALCKRDVMNLNHTPDANGVKYVRSSKKADYAHPNAPLPSPAVLTAIEQLRRQNDLENQGNTSGSMASALQIMDSRGSRDSSESSTTSRQAQVAGGSFNTAPIQRRQMAAQDPLRVSQNLNHFGDMGQPTPGHSRAFQGHLHSKDMDRLHLQRQQTIGSTSQVTPTRGMFSADVNGLFEPGMGNLRHHKRNHSPMDNGNRQGHRGSMRQHNPQAQQTIQQNMALQKQNPFLLPSSPSQPSPLRRQNMDDQQRMGMSNQDTNTSLPRNSYQMPPPATNNLRRTSTPMHNDNNLPLTPQHMSSGSMYQQHGYQMGSNRSSFQPQMPVYGNGMLMEEMWQGSYTGYPQNPYGVSENQMMLPNQGFDQLYYDSRGTHQHGQFDGNIMPQFGSPQTARAQQHSGIPLSNPGPPLVANYEFDGMATANFMGHGLPQTTSYGSNFLPSFEFGSSSGVTAQYDIMSQQSQPSYRNQRNSKRNFDEAGLSDTNFYGGGNWNNKRHHGDGEGNRGLGQMHHTTQASVQERPINTPELPTVVPALAPIVTSVSARNVSPAVAPIIAPVPLSQPRPLSGNQPRVDSSMDIKDNVQSFLASEKSHGQSQAQYLEESLEQLEQFSDDIDLSHFFDSPPQENMSPITTSRGPSDRSAEDPTSSQIIEGFSDQPVQVSSNQTMQVSSNQYEVTTAPVDSDRAVATSFMDTPLEDLDVYNMLNDYFL